MRKIAGIGLEYHKIPKISPGAYIFQRPFLRGLSTEGNIRFKVDWASLINGRKFTVFALFYIVFEGNFQVQAPGGAYIWRGDLRERFCVTSLGGLNLEGLIHGGAYFRDFTVVLYISLSMKKIEVSPRQDNGERRKKKQNEA